MSQQAATNCIESVQQYCNYGYDENLYSSNSDCRRNKTCDSSQFGETTPYITPNDKRHSKVIKDSVVVWASLIGGYMLIEKGYKKSGYVILGFSALALMSSQANFGGGWTPSLLQVISFDLLKPTE
tara:strand:- start:4399 stop:4776 length:378 start_codon:yes stop_codon:yes gene_type:complete